MVSYGKSYWGAKVSELILAATVKGADLALQVPRLRSYALDKLLRRLAWSYDENEPDEETLTHDRWFASHLIPFLQRVVNERPVAARAILRFIGTWTRDVYRRSEAHKAGLVAPCTVVIEPTDRCSSDLPYEQMARIVEEVIDMGVTLITISGGEPFLRERADRTITRLADRFDDRGFLVYTNGTLIDEETAGRLGKLGNVFPAISVEGFEHQTDARRGRGVYQRDRQVRRSLAERGVMTGFSATVTRENCEAICTDGFLDLRIAEGDLFGWFFILQPIGRSPRPDLMVTADQRALLRETIIRWRREDRPVFLGDFWNDGPLVGGCIAGGRYYFHICANGDISPCVFAPVASGNIFDIIEGRSRYSSLSQFVQEDAVFRAFRDEQARITDRARPCLLIDHPQAFRRIWQMGGCRATKNFPPGYADGEIARAVDQAARQWRQKCAQLPPMIHQAQAREEPGSCEPTRTEQYASRNRSGQG